MLKALKKYKAPYLFILPFFILFFVFQLVPTIWTFYISFTDWKGIGDPEFSGLGNYKKMMVDNMFWESLGNTVVYWLTGLVFILFQCLKHVLPPPLVTPGGLLSVNRLAVYK